MVLVSKKMTFIQEVTFVNLFDESFFKTYRVKQK